jgi:hypothetical protein
MYNNKFIYTNYSKSKDKTNGCVLFHVRWKGWKTGGRVEEWVVKCWKWAVGLKTGCSCHASATMRRCPASFQKWAISLICVEKGWKWVVEGIVVVRVPYWCVSSCATVTILSLSWSQSQSQSRLSSCLTLFLLSHCCCYRDSQ